MDYISLQKGNKIEEELRHCQRVLEHFNGWESGKSDPTEFVVKYLTECRNVGDGSTRKILAISFINDSIKFLETKQKMLREEFEEL